MANIWFWSDPHLGHDNIIQYCGRPFANSDLMNECLLDNANQTVKWNDKFYWLGDTYMGMSDDEAHRLLVRMPGKKRLLLGNHDNPKSPALVNNFEKIQLWNGFWSDGIGFTAGHIPFPLEHLRDGKYMLHGHTHNHILSDNHYINNCVENIGYAPIHLDTVIEMIKKRMKENKEKPSRLE